MDRIVRRVIPIVTVAKKPAIKPLLRPIGPRVAPQSKEALKEAMAKALGAPKEGEEREVNEGGYSYSETIARYAAKVTNPLSAIRAKCVECSGGSLKEVANCHITKCSLHPFRMGTNPLHKRTKEKLARQEEEE